VLALTGTLGVGVAQAAKVDMQWSVMIGTPVYNPPVPVVVQPLPVYQRRCGFSARRSINERRTCNRLAGIATETASRTAMTACTTRDRDGDGIPNRYDRHTARGWQAR
jgi:hypothetical protein